MAVRDAVVSVGTTATALKCHDAKKEVGLVGKHIFLTNVSAGTVYIGGSGVLTTTGVPLVQNASMNYQMEDGLDYPYGVVASSTSNVRVMVTGTAPVPA